MKRNHLHLKFDTIDLSTTDWQDYELVDSGNQKKLERFGAYYLIRFEPQAVWKPALPKEIWQSTDAELLIEKGKSMGRWQFNHEIPDAWQVAYHQMNLEVRISGSRHIGLFPEQCQSWDWIENKIRSEKETVRVLNLFGYTGVASLFAARAGAQVTHVDASRAAVKWGQRNLELNNLKDRGIRWLIDDVFKFVERENRRGSTYEGILLDPPRFGRGPKGEVWKFEKAIPELLHLCKNILSPQPLFVYLTAYDVENSPAELCSWLAEITRHLSGKLECGSLVQQEKSAGRKIHQAMFARWSTIK
jgi:23S rRNA (cytosine1962-C5)-methyltransferase